MSVSPDDPRLTAYLLGELPADEAEELRKSLAADPSLEAALKEIEDLRNLLGETLPTPSVGLHSEQRDAIRRAAILADRTSKIAPLPATQKKKPPFRFFILPLAAAAAILLAVFLIPSKDPEASDASRSASTATPPPNPLKPSPGPLDISRQSAAPPRPIAPNLPELALRNSIMASEVSSISLPVRSGDSSFKWIEESIFEKGELPAPNAVRLEEILNHFPLRPSGAAAVSHGITLSAETLPCPWRPSSILLFVSVRGASAADHQVSARFQTQSESVLRYRLLGYASLSEQSGNGQMESLVPAGSLTTVALEIEPIASATRLGSIQWSVDGNAAAEVPIISDPAAEPSDDARFATLVCAFSQWLSGDQSGIIDEQIVAGLAREVAADDLPPERFRFLELIDRSLNLE